jgi:hypothetical protein
MDLRAWLVVVALLVVYGLVGEAEYESLEALTEARVQMGADYAGNGHGSLSHD